MMMVGLALCLMIMIACNVCVVINATVLHVAVVETVDLIALDAVGMIHRSSLHMAVTRTVAMIATDDMHVFVVDTVY